MIHDNVLYEVTNSSGKSSEVLGVFLKAMMRDGYYPASYKEAEVK